MECCTLLRAMQLDADALVFADAYAEALNHLNPLFSWCTTCWPQYKHIFIRTYSVRISYTYTFIVALPLHLDVNPGQKFRDREQVPFLLAKWVKRLPFDSKLNMCHAKTHFKERLSWHLQPAFNWKVIINAGVLDVETPNYFSGLLTTSNMLTGRVEGRKCCWPLFPLILLTSQWIWQPQTRPQLQSPTEISKYKQVKWYRLRNEAIQSASRENQDQLSLHEVNPLTPKNSDHRFKKSIESNKKAAKYP